MKSSSTKLKKSVQSVHSKSKGSNRVEVGDKEDAFITRFKQFCADNGCQPEEIPAFPKANVLQKKGGKSAENVSIRFQAEVVYRDLDKTIDKFLCKYFKLRFGAVKALEMTLDYFPGLTVLKLEFCDLTEDSIEMLSDFIATNPNIKEVSVAGNPNPLQNHHTLLNNLSVTHLSLRFCNITSYGMERIATKLADAFSSTLLHLDLSSNSLFDEGVLFVSRILRVNRTLLSLNLADNKITDAGCTGLLAPLQQFALDLDEIVLRRRRRFEYYKRKYEMMKMNNISPVPIVPDFNMEIVPKQTRQDSTHVEPKKTKSGSANRKRPKSSEQLGSKTSRSSRRSRLSARFNKRKSTEDIERTRLIAKIESDLGSDPHPFVKDSWEENKQIICKGNFKIFYINISYNKITKESVKMIEGVVRYQLSTESTQPTGLMKVNLEGNNIPSDNEGSSSLNILLSAKSEKIRSRRTSASATSFPSSKKKPSFSKLARRSLN